MTHQKSFTIQNDKETEVKDLMKFNVFNRYYLIKWIIYFGKYISVEPLVMCYVFGKNIFSAALIDLQYEKACRATARYNDSTCDNILKGARDDLHIEFENVQNIVGNYMSLIVPLEQLVPLTLILFLGAYSDKYKMRKPFILIPIVGQLTFGLFCILCVIFMKQWNLEILGLVKVLSSAFGGNTMFYMAVYSFIGDVSSLKMRTLRIGVIQLVQTAFTAFGKAIGAVVYPKVGYLPIFTISCCSFMTGVLYGFCLIREKSLPYEGTPGIKQRFLDLFNTKHAADTFGLLLTRKETVNRTFLLAVLLLMLMVSGVNKGEYDILSQYTRLKFNWSSSDFILYITLYDILISVATSSLLPFLTKVLMLGDLALIVIFLLDKIIAALLISFGGTLTFLYVATVIGSGHKIVPIGIRSLITKIVPWEDSGKAQSLMAVMGAIGPAMFEPVYNQLYNHLPRPHKELTYLLSIGILSVDTVLAMCLTQYENKTLDQEATQSKSNSLTNEIIQRPIEETHV